MLHAVLEAMVCCLQRRPPDTCMMHKLIDKYTTCACHEQVAYLVRRSNAEDAAASPRAELIIDSGDAVAGELGGCASADNGESLLCPANIEGGMGPVGNRVRSNNFTTMHTTNLNNATMLPWQHSRRGDGAGARCITPLGTPLASTGRGALGAGVALPGMSNEESRSGAMDAASACNVVTLFMSASAKRKRRPPPPLTVRGLGFGWEGSTDPRFS